MSPDILPEFLGGNLPNDDYADLDLASRLMSSDEYYKGNFDMKLHDFSIILTCTHWDFVFLDLLEHGYPDRSWHQVYDMNKPIAS